MPAFAPEQWRALSPYLDKALEIPTEERAAWLDLLREENPSLATDLQALLKEHDALGDEGFLAEAPARLAALLPESAGDNASVQPILYPPDIKSRWPQIFPVLEHEQIDLI